MSDVFPTFRKCYDGTYLREWFVPGNWKTELENSDLPQQITDLISATINSSKLWRSEKISVTRELIAHFQDGHQRGFDFQKLVDEFGEADIAAQLISRSKERNRPMMAKIAKLIGMTAVVAIAVTLAMFLFLFLGKATPNVNYVADLNVNSVDYDEQEKAWPIYRDAWIEHNFVRLDDTPIYYRDPDTDEQTRLLRPGDDGWEDAVALIKDHQSLLDAFRKGAKLPALGLELQMDYADYAARDLEAMNPGWTKKAEPSDEELLDTPLVMGVLLPHIQQLRMAGRLLMIDSRLAFEEDDPERVIENIETIFGIARQAKEPPVLVCSLVGLVIANQGFGVVEEVVREQSAMFSDEQLEHIQTLVASQDLRSFINFEGERALGHDVFQNVFTDDGNGDGRMTFTGLKLLYSLVPALSGHTETPQELGLNGMISASFASRKKTAEEFDRFIERAEESMTKAIYEQPLDDDESIVESYGNGLRVLIGPLVPRVGIIRDSLEKRLARQNAIELGVAMERFARRHGALPGDLNALVPDYIDEVPVDRITGDFMKYTLIDGKPTIYSVGVDGDDDGGQPIQVEDFSFKLEGRRNNGDWILWPTQFELVF